MEMILTKLFREMIFWLAWIIIPMMWEVIPAFLGFLLLIKRKIQKKNYREPTKYPEITVIVPVYNSEKTLEGCLDSIYESDYPRNMINVYVVDNGSHDSSYDVFVKCQKRYNDMPFWWLKSGQGKSKALNLALFNSSGKYIFNVDSDGLLEKSAIKNMVTRFENEPELHCMTGAIMVQPELIERTEGFFLRMLRRCENFEYSNAFLAGRVYQAELSSVYTLSGACSAFRKSVILKTFLYNSVTVCEDTHVTFQIRANFNYDVKICEDALFFVDPIEDLNKLYTQRQRWQRGELEVSHMFLQKEMKPWNFFKNFMVRVLMYDHTFAFPRVIWIFAVFYLFFNNYPLTLIIGANAIMYALYTLSAFMFFSSVRVYLKKFPEIRKYYTSNWYICFLYPLYNLLVFFIRFAGIINSITTDMTWKTKNITEEKNAFIEVLKQDFQTVNKIITKLRKGLNAG